MILYCIILNAVECTFRQLSTIDSETSSVPSERSTLLVIVAASFECVIFPCFFSMEVFRPWIRNTHCKGVRRIVEWSVTKCSRRDCALKKHT